ncbi:MAG: ADP-heptose-lipooligosaccharide heptosyltransferase II [Fluviibacter phosphoraccumulans EoVTN8]
MDIRFQRAVDKYAGVPLCALFTAWDWCIRKLGLRRKPAAEPKRILVILLSEMGSLVLAEPMFQRIKARYLGAELHVMLFAKNREVLDLLNVVPKQNVITLNDSNLKDFASDMWEALQKMRTLRFDVVIDCELFARVSSLIAYMSGAPVLVGFEPHTQEGLYRGGYLTNPVMYNPYRHLSYQLLTMVDAIEATSYPAGKTVPTDEAIKPPTLTFNDGEVAAEASKLEADFPTIASKPLVLIYPSGGILPIRAWPLENYYRVADHFLQQGYAVGVIGLKGDKAFGQAVLNHTRHLMCIDLTGYTRSVRHLLALFHRAALLITNDGGPGQFAAMTPIPTIILFGPETPRLYQSWAKNAYFFHQPLACSPCLTAYNHRMSPCDGDNQCLKQITPDQVLAKAHELLGLPPTAQPVAFTLESR